MATILVADDDAAVREFVRVLLAGRGHRVLLAENPEDALAIAAAERVGLLVTFPVEQALSGPPKLKLLRRSRGSARPRRSSRSRTGWTSSSPADWWTAA